MNSNRVVITGMGVVSPIGNNLDEFWANLKIGYNGIDNMGRIMCSTELDVDEQPEGEVIVKVYVPETAAIYVDVVDPLITPLALVHS